MKKIRHSRLPITLESSDNLTLDFLKSIEFNMKSTGWDLWIDEYGNWFRPMKLNLNQLELFNKK
tara:strand:+ start:460 stop:651 length:192 start_codon:yes stop_codon:yes gene_type:complete